MNRVCRAVFVWLLLLLPARGADAFSLLFAPSPLDLQTSLQTAPRWTATAGLADGIQIGVAPGFATALGATNPAEVALVNQAVANAFAAWESPVLSFDVTFDSPALEVGLFAGVAPQGFFGVTIPTYSFGLRPLTNGQVFFGEIITSAGILIDAVRTQQFAALFGLTQQQRLDALQRLIMHEFGHALGFGHPNSNNQFGAEINLDTDFDPLNPMLIDPLDPFGDLLVSTFTDNESIMSNRACGGTTFCASLVFTALQNDELGGRDVLYPVPEPSTAALAVAGLALVGLLAKRRGGRLR